MPGTVWLTNRSTGTDEPFAPEQVTGALATGKYVDPGAVAVHAQGLDTYVAPEQARQDSLFTPAIDPALAQQAYGHRLREQENSGPGSALKAAFGGAVGTASFGLVNPFREAQEFNPIATGAGELAGLFVPYGAGSWAAMAGHAVSELGEGAGLLGRMGAATAGGATEGSILGVGQGVHELATSDDPLTVEHIASTLGSNMLFGGTVGGAAGLGGKLAESALQRAKGSIDGMLAKSAPVSLADAATAGTEGSAVDLSQLDARGLKAARDAEVEQIRQAQQPEREKFVKDLEDAHRRWEPQKEWLSIVADRNEDKYTREAAAALLRKGDRRIRDLLDNKAGLVDRPQRALDALQTEHQAIETLLEAGRREIDAYYAAMDEAPTKIKQELIDGSTKIPGYVIGRGAISPTSSVVDDLVKKVVAERFPTYPGGAPILPKELVGFSGPELELAKMANERLQGDIARLISDPTSQRLEAIDAARDALGGPKEHGHGLGSSVLHAAAAISGPIGAAAAVGSQALGGLRKVAGAAARQTGKAASAFLDVASKATAKAPLATVTLAGMQYAPKATMARLGIAAETGDSLPALFKQRTNEIKAQVVRQPDGSFAMAPSARQQMATNFDGIRMANPILADRLEELSARRLIWLAGQIPRRPDINGMQIGPDNWQPSDLEMRSWARKAAAAEDPYGVLDRIASGAVSPEDVMTMRAVHPEILADYRDQVSHRLPELQKTLPYNRRLALAIFTGMPVDPAMHPQVLGVLQAQFPAEPGSAGGTQAPKPVPQFGAIKKSPDAPTPAQTRAQGAHAA